MNEELVAAVEDYLKARDEIYPRRQAEAREKMRKIVKGLKTTTPKETAPSMPRKV